MAGGAKLPEQDWEWITAPGLEDPGSGWSVPVLAEGLLRRAVREGASDLHGEPGAHDVSIRLRCSGELTELKRVSRDIWPSLVQRLKLLAGLDIADQRRPQDGGWSLNVDHRSIDIRLSTMPTLHGEAVVARLLERDRALLSLDQLGFSPHVLRALRRVLAQPWGLTVFTGPTGSGKTTSLYALLHELTGENLSLLTLEDPIEYRLDGLRQTAINEAAGLSFAVGLRALLRQDPDVILIGEIRDGETARLALRAALSGKRVLTTLHAGDTLGVMPRLLELGLERSLLAGALCGVVSQRLVRKRGGQERVAVGEVLEIDESLRDLILAGAPRAAWRQALARMGFVHLAEDAQMRLTAGELDPDSLARVLDVTPQEAAA
ncbi:MAG: type II/IV secretion system protein [Alphaproteobacteria bacterium]|nr:MAG: type II/IV secretion system protein [Alphaproteobacteria bacterium]